MKDSLKAVIFHVFVFVGENGQEQASTLIRLECFLFENHITAHW